MAVFQGYLYMATSPPLQIWRTANGRDWTLVEDNGFADPTTNNSGKLVVFQNKLYAATSVATVGSGNGCEIWRSSDGVNWSAIVATGESTALRDDGFGISTVGGCISTAVFEDTSTPVFKEKLFVGTVNHGPVGRQIWSFDGSVWEDVTPDLLRDRGVVDTSLGIMSLGVFGGRLFAGDRLTLASIPAAVYATSSGDPSEWTIVGGGGDFGSSIAIQDMHMTSSGFFYIATTNHEEGAQVYQKVPTLPELVEEMGLFDVSPVPIGPPVQPIVPLGPGGSGLPEKPGG
jgi:hypothetical protein